MFWKQCVPAGFHRSLFTQTVWMLQDQEVKDLGRHMIRKMELDTAPTHMEWFFGDKGLKFSEIGARPLGVGHWDIYCAANDIDL